MKDMNEKNIKLEEEFKKLKFEMWKEAKKILETEYPRRDGQLDGECTVQMAKLQKKFNKKINEGAVTKCVTISPQPLFLLENFGL